MDLSRVRAYSSGNGSRVEDRQEVASRRGGCPMMEFYTIAGLAAVGLAMGLVGLRLAKDEMLLKRKRLLAE